MTIKDARKSRGMTQEELAELINVKRSTVAMWENGSNIPRTGTLIRIAQVLECTTDELLGYERRKETREEIIARRVADARATLGTEV